MKLLKRPGIAFFWICLLACSQYCLAADGGLAPAELVAHAGGAVNKKTYTNSLEALNANYAKGFRFFEMDFSWTSDGEMVAIHDWEAAFRKKFIVPEEIKIPTKTQFLALKTTSGLTPLSLEGVLTWAREKGDAFIITDVKDGNIKALRKIRQDFGGIQKFIIPQVYSYSEYDEANRLGYPYIILTLYRMRINFDDVVEFSRQKSPFAVTMPWQVAQAGLSYYLDQNNTKVYAHTVNDIELYDSLKKIGVHGIYTDFISP